MTVKKSFSNLSAQRQEEIITQSMEVFAGMPYEEVTLKVLLEKLALHPATFYRYFDGKEELYLFLLMRLNEKQDAYLRAKYPEYEAELFTFYTDTGELSQLERDFGKTFMRLPNSVLLRSYLEVSKDYLFGKYKEGLRRLRYAGKLRPDVDEDLVCFMFATTMFNMTLFFKEYDIRDLELQSKLKKYFYTEFFRHGLVTDSAFEDEA